jgi:hypothetical protein
MPNNMIQPCRTMNDLQGCLSADTHCVPTVEFTVENINVPLDETGYNFFNAPEINLFATGQQVRQSGVAPARASSRGLSEPTFTFDTPFVLLGICVYAYADPYSMVVQGNHFSPQADFATAGHLPASPMNLRQALVGDLFGLGGGWDGQVSPAQLEHGGPLWRAIWAFMHAYRLEMRCPSSDYDLLMDEALSDIGNCCSQMSWDGFGNSGAGHIVPTRDLNDRLASVNLPPTGGFGADNGFLVPWNSEQFNDGQIVPEVYTSEPAAYGRPISYPAVEQWYRLPCPIPFPSIPQPKLKITLKKVDGDQDYSARLLQELQAFRDLNPVPGIGSSHFPLNDGPVVGDEEGFGGMTRFPHGQLRIGLGLKGFEVRASVCDDLMAMLAGKTFGELQAMPELKGVCLPAGQLMQTPYSGPGMTCGPVGTNEGR